MDDSDDEPFKPTPAKKLTKEQGIFIQIILYAIAIVLGGLCILNTFIFFMMLQPPQYSYDLNGEWQNTVFNKEQILKYAWTILTVCMIVGAVAVTPNATKSRAVIILVFAVELFQVVVFFGFLYELVLANSSSEPHNLANSLDYVCFYGVVCDGMTSTAVIEGLSVPWQFWLAGGCVVISLGGGAAVILIATWATQDTKDVIKESADAMGFGNSSAQDVASKKHKSSKNKPKKEKETKSSKLALHSTASFNLGKGGSTIQRGAGNDFSFGEFKGK